MSKPVMLILYVKQVKTSVHFYQEILECSPTENHPNFAMFQINDGLMLGLWAKHEMQPTTTAQPGASELDLIAQSNAIVDTTHALWTNKGISIVMPPTQLDFGYNFVAVDPDGHRVRVFHPNDQH